MTPLAFPDAPSGVAAMRFEIERVDLASPEANGRQGGVQAGWPLWTASYEIGRSDPDSADLWHVFHDRLRGRQRVFLAHDTTRPFPKAAAMGFAGMVRAGGSIAFTGSALAWSQNIDGDGNARIAMTGLPANFKLSERDLIGFKWDAAGAPAGSYYRRAMVRVVAAANASAAGAITVMVEPPLDIRVVPANAIAHLDRPACLMRMIPDKTDLSPIGAGGGFSGGTIFAGQDLRA